MGNPVLVLELLLAGRRSRAPLARYAYASLAALQLAAVAWAVARAPEYGWDAHAAIELYLLVSAAEIFAAVTLAAPAQMAGALASEKSAGTLPLLLTTELSAWQIATGKLLACLPRLFAFSLIGFPFYCFVGV